MEFRHESIGLLRARWHVLTFGAYLSELSVYLVLLVSLRLVGVSESEVSWSVVLASFALVRILQSIPITPGGMGVVELGLTGALVAAGGDHTEVVAGVLVFRALTWLPPLLTGPFFYLGWRAWLRRHHIDDVGRCAGPGRAGGRGGGPGGAGLRSRSVGRALVAPAVGQHPQPVAGSAEARGRSSS